MNNTMVHNLKVMSARMQSSVPTEDFCKAVWKKLGLSGESYRSALAAVIAQTAVERELLPYVDEADVVPQAAMIGYMVAQAFTYTPEGNVIQYFLDEVEKRWGPKALRILTTLCAHPAKDLYGEYVAARQKGRIEKSPGREVAMSILFKKSKAPFRPCVK